MKSTETKPKIGGKSAPKVIMTNDPSPSAEDRLSHIATAAYYRAEARCFVSGQELDDWLQAEAEFD